MRIQFSALPILLLFAGLQPGVLLAQESILPAAPPHLEKRGAATQLIVDGKPFLMLAGELSNSASSSLEHMKPVWPKLAAMGLNTVLTPVSWELIEPKEGRYDFALVDGLLDQARQEHLHIVFLWLASWKNGMSSYPPAWVKEDTRRFPRVMVNGSEAEVLSPASAATEEADGRAFAALLKHLKEADARDHTVLAIQVENEVGVLGDSRDRSEAANKAFVSAVPKELMQYVQAHRGALDPEFRALWEANGSKITGTWAEIFGDTTRADEIFMAWNYARFVHGVAARGKAAYGIPLYVNTWLAGEDAPPGDYPSGGPQPRVLDVWKAAGTALDMYSPDLYASDFAGWSNRYHRDGNPLFIPETNSGAAGAANVFYAVGEQNAICFSPFAIEHSRDEKGDLTASYNTIAKLAPLLLEKQQTAGATHGFVLDKNHTQVDFTMSGYTVHVSLDEIFGHRAESGYGLIVATGTDEFLGAGKGFRVSFTPRAINAPKVGIAAVDEGAFEDGKWVPGQRLNGDENDQGRGWRFSSWQMNTERVMLYHFE
jgi:beta-galactosidase GanA